MTRIAEDGAFEGMGDFRSQMSRVKIALDDDTVIQRFLMIIGLEIEGETKRNIKRLDLILTGNLRASITTLVVAARVVIVGTNAVYAAIHELGGLIRPKNKAFLRFKTKDGHWVTTKKVNIPARPYLRPAFKTHHVKGLQEAAKYLFGVIERAVSSI